MQDSLGGDDAQGVTQNYQEKIVEEKKMSENLAFLIDSVSKMKKDLFKTNLTPQTSNQTIQQPHIPQHFQQTGLQLWQIMLFTVRTYNSLQKNKQIFLRSQYEILMKQMYEQYFKLKKKEKQKFTVLDKNLIKKEKEKLKYKKKNKEEKGEINQEELENVMNQQKEKTSQKKMKRQKVKKQQKIKRVKKVQSKQEEATKELSKQKLQNKTQQNNSEEQQKCSPIPQHNKLQKQLVNNEQKINKQLTQHQLQQPTHNQTPTLQITQPPQQKTPSQTPNKFLHIKIYSPTQKQQLLKILKNIKLVEDFLNLLYIYRSTCQMFFYQLVRDKFNDKSVLYQFCRKYQELQASYCAENKFKTHASKFMEIKRSLTVYSLYTIQQKSINSALKFHQFIQFFRLDPKPWQLQNYNYFHYIHKLGKNSPNNKLLNDILKTKCFICDGQYFSSSSINKIRCYKIRMDILPSIMMWNCEIIENVRLLQRKVEMVRMGGWGETLFSFF